jgi:Zn-dependent protease with chaperone function
MRSGRRTGPVAPSPGRPFGLLLAGSLLGTAGLAAATARLAIAAAGGAWPGLSADGVRCLLVPTPADLGAHVLSYLFGVALVVSAAWTAAVLVAQGRGTRRLARAVAARRVARAPRTLRRATRRLGLEGRVDVVGEERPYAFCYGLLRPRICASLGLARHLEAREVEAVLRHERYHLRARDPLKLAVGRALATALFFLPVVADLLRRYELARELAADRRAVAEMRGSRPLAGALYQLLTAPAPPGGPLPGWLDGGAVSLAAIGGGAPTRPAGARGGRGGRPGPSIIDVRIAQLVDEEPPAAPLVSARSVAVSGVSLAAVSAPLLLPGPSRAAAAALAQAHLVPGLC